MDFVIIQGCTLYVKSTLTQTGAKQDEVKLNVSF